MDRYQLPEIKALKNIGFEFQYPKLKDVIPYIQNFVIDRSKELIEVYFPDKIIRDDAGNIIDKIVWADPAEIKDEIFNKTEKDLIEKILRIEKGIIKLNDHALLVHRKFRKDKDVLLRALNRRLRSIYGATGSLIYRFGIWDLSFQSSARECLYHQILDDIICRIAEVGKIPPADWNPQYKVYLDKKRKADEYKAAHPGKDKVLSVASYYWEADKELMTFSDEIFSTNNTLEKNARNIIRKASMSSPKPILTNIENKERTIIFYLRLQSKSVIKRKNNRKSNKGVQENKRKAVIDLYKSAPDLTISGLIRLLPPGIQVDRKTVSKYIREFNG